MTKDKLDVDFVAVKSNHDNCSCDCCHGLGKVIKMRIPEAKYHDGNGLTTKYHNWWMCEECWEKLIKAVEESPAEGG
jgi:hypothetical protein